LATRWTAIIVWILAALDVAALLEPARDGLTRALAAKYQVGEIGLSAGAVLTFIATIWAAVLISRLLRFVLNEEIFSRLPLPRGIPYALTTILHYVLLVGGVLIAIVSTGVNLDRFTIIAGAVGVGVGFGLQGIVNNFVSGLILLFERPIKVGDSVEMANRGGQIQHIGIRACVMRTGDGAEIIVPNSMLITSEVTNWTLSDRQRRIEIPIGVGYGNDPEHVMQLLTQVAQEHDDILAYPVPEAQFAGFGAHALEFKLGAWTGRPERGGSIRSELCVQIYKVLTRENIEIPYPQSTLHLRSFDAGVVESFRQQPRRRTRRNGERGEPGDTEPVAASFEKGGK
jgi:small-conductance mechanosensitive channel